METIDKFDDTKDPLPYLYTISRNKCITYLRRRTVANTYVKYTTEQKKDYLNLVLLKNESQTDIYDSDIRGLLQKALRRMPTKVRDTYILSRTKELKNHELASNIFLHGEVAEKADDRNVLSAENVEVFTHKGVVSKVLLPDSTVVWMNAGTKLQYPSDFSDGLREVHISGEAFFEVKRDESRPMVITTNRNAGISVLGTSFLVKSYEDEDISKVTLFNGSVRYSDPDREDLNIIPKPGESIICSKADSSFKVVEINDLSREIAWRDGNLIFDKTPMRDVIRTLERWYGTEFKILNESIYNYTLTATFYSESVTQVMELIKYCIPVKYAKENNVVTIYLK